MDMMMLIFRTSLKTRVQDILRTAGIHAYTEIPETVGAGQTGPAEGISYYPGINSVILVAVEPPQRDQVATAIKVWCDETIQRSGWVKPAIRVFAWPCNQLV
ncbi:MAG: hypothetical protein U0172_01425 [Nitrospiraceae bacterium]